jgi:cytochrome c biogenesis protein CcmG/thiol:disulfide interchange protein DsbE
MRMKWNVWILIVVAAAIVAVIAMNHNGKDAGTPVASGALESPSDAQSDPAAPKKGSPAPAFKLSSLDGSSTYQVGGKREKALIINFWASWCGPCELEAPDLKAVYQKYRSQIDLYAVNATKYDKLRGAKDFVKEQQLPFPVLTDAAGEAGDSYKVHYYPTSFIVDRNGKIRQRIEGVISLEQWEKYLDEITSS